jgi:hypothetical protein
LLDKLLLGIILQMLQFFLRMSGVALDILQIVFKINKNVRQCIQLPDIILVYENKNNINIREILNETF